MEHLEGTRTIHFLFPLLMGGSHIGQMVITRLLWIKGLGTQHDRHILKNRSVTIGPTIDGYRPSLSGLCIIDDIEQSGFSHTNETY